MGRDMTPREQHKTDLTFPDLKYTKMTWGNISTPLYDFESRLGQNYPNLLFLFGEENMNGFKDVTLAAFEQHLANIIHADDTSCPVPNADRPEVASLTAWYDGKLDKGFYYREENNRLLMEVMAEFEKEPEKPA